MRCGPQRRSRSQPRPEALEPRQLLAVSGSFWVGFQAGLAAPAERRLLVRAGAELVESLPGGLARASIDAETTAQLDAAFNRLARMPGIRYVERDRTLTVEAFPTNDFYSSSQWGLSQSNDVDINAPEAWAFGGGRSSIIVAVIDSGVEIDHPDLASQLWTNPREVPNNGFDDDGNGYADDLHGWNFLTNTGNLADEAEHGTHVAGIIAAQANNGRGVAGVNPGVKLMPLKFIDGQGNGSTNLAVQAIYYAVRNGAKVINASWGGGGNSRALADAIRYAGSRGVVFVTAAGNEGRNLDTFRSYPASFGQPTMLAVAAVDASGRLAGFSNRGRKSVQIAAPGVDIISTLGRSDYMLMSGTSMATPFVAGVASMLMAANPQLSAQQVVQRLIATAKPLPGLQGKVVSGGIVDAARALNPPKPTPTPVSAPRRTTTSRPTSVSRARLGAGDLARADLLGSSDYFGANGGSLNGFVQGLYADVLGRPASSSEVSGAVQRLGRGTSRVALARELLGSDEAGRTKVARWYLQELAAPATLESLKAYGPAVNLARQLRSGIRESQVHAELLGSDEFAGPYAGNATRLADGLYQATLGRAATSDESSFLASRLASGVTTFSAATFLLGTQEARLTRAARWLQSDLDLVMPLAELKSNALAVTLAARLTD